MPYIPRRRGYSGMGRRGTRRLLTAMVGAAVAATVSLVIAPVMGQQAPAYHAPRANDGHPDLNGIWQALNEANWDIQTHGARPALATRRGPNGPVPASQVLALGAVASVPPGQGVVEGNELPYLPAALERKKKNQDNWLT